MHYFNKKNNFLHGIMFHHFHDRTKHIGLKDQSIPKILQNNKIYWKKNILNADDFLKRQIEILN